MSKQSLNSGTWDPYSHPPADATQIYTDALEWPPLPCSVVGDTRLRLSLDTKLRLYQTCVLQILLYGADTWTLLANDIRKLQSFHMGGQRQILGVRWQDHVKNVDIADTTGLPNITDSRQETSNVIRIHAEH